MTSALQALVIILQFCVFGTLNRDESARLNEQQTYSLC